MAESQIEIGPDARNLRLRQQEEIVKKGPSQTTYSPSLGEVQERGTGGWSGSKSAFWEPRNYSENETPDRNVQNAGNF